MSNRVIRRVVALLLVGVLMLGAFYIGTMVVATNARSPITFEARAQIVNTPPPNATEYERLLADLYSRVAPSVVAIEVVSSFTHPVLDQQFSQGAGTGFVLDQQGHIVTNFHVVDGAVQIEVKFFDGTIVRGETVGLDPDSDIAVLRVDLPAEQLVPVPLGDSDALFVGQTAIAIGSPFGREWTMTTGIVSALGRTIRGLNIYSIGQAIQTDAAINPGNSGGPLLNLAGEVIGINAQIASEVRANSGVGFAIPSNLVRRVTQSLIEKGRVDYSYIGIGGDDMSLAQIEALDLPNNARGVVVQRVEPGSPAARAGLRNPGSPRQIDGIVVPTQVDIITAIDGQQIGSMEDLIGYLASSTRPGQTVNLSILRDGTEQITLPVTLSARPVQ